MFKYAILAAAAMFSTETQAIQLNTEQRIKMREQIDAAIDEYLTAKEDSHAEWGFLKNIVNIDRFFSGPQAWMKHSTRKSINWKSCLAVEEQFTKNSHHERKLWPNK